MSGLRMPSHSIWDGRVSSFRSWLGRSIAPPASAGKMKEIHPGLYQISTPGVNAFLIDSGSKGLTLVDAASGHDATEIRAAVASLGRDIRDIRHILVTHCHPDHAGGLAKLKALTSARIYMHRRDAMLVATGRAMRRLLPAPGLANAILYKTMIAPKPKTVPPVKADVLVGNGDLIPAAGDIEVIHTPGHTEGHLVFLDRERGAAFLGDGASNLFGLNLMIAYEHLQQGIMSLRNLSKYDFDIACFGHGPAIKKDAGKRFKEKWGQGGGPRSSLRPESEAARAGLPLGERKGGTTWASFGGRRRRQKE